MNWKHSGRLLGAFLLRDFFTETSYKLATLLSFSGVFFTTFSFYFISQLLGQAAPAVLAQYGGDYFAFVVIGVALASYSSLGLNGFSSVLREAQTTGTLEAMLMTPTPVSLLVVGSAGWSYAFTTVRILLYLLLGLVLGVDLRGANLPAALLILLLTVIAFASIGIIAASFIIVFKRGNPVTGLFGSVSSLLGGVFYPVELLPGWLQPLASLLPITYALRAMRGALLTAADWRALAPDIAILALFCVLLFPLSLLAFRHAVQLARRDGTLSHY